MVLYGRNFVWDGQNGPMAGVYKFRRSSLAEARVDMEFDRLLADSKLHYVEGVLWAYLTDFRRLQAFQWIVGESIGRPLGLALC